MLPGRCPVGLPGVLLGAAGLLPGCRVGRRTDPHIGGLACQAAGLPGCRVRLLPGCCRVGRSAPGCRGQGRQNTHGTPLPPVSRVSPLPCPLHSESVPRIAARGAARKELWSH
jgi:hypothetical protein